MCSSRPGASEEAKSLADQAITVPMAPAMVESLNVSVAAALIMNEARQMRVRQLGRCADLSEKEVEILTAIMLLKHRGGNAVTWHPHWKSSRDAAAAPPAVQAAAVCAA